MFAPSRQLLTIRCVTTAGSRGCEPGDRLSDEGWSLSGAGALGEDGGDWYTGQSRQVLEVADLCGARTGRPGSDDQSDRLDAAGTQCVHRSEEHTSELQSLMRISYAVFCLKKKKKNNKQ